MKSIKIAILTLFVLINTNGFGQEGFKINFSADIVSRFIYRGSNVGGLTAHIQPIVVGSSKHFDIGAFGSYGVQNNYSELDLFCTYNYKNISVTFMNYNIPISQTISGNYNRTTTINVGEVSVNYSGYEGFPTIFVAVSLYGDHNRCSTYIEITQPIIHTTSESLDLFLGLTPFKSFYADKFSLVNIGMKYCRDITITQDFSLPTYIMLCGNPAKKGIHLVFGITI